MSEFTRRDAIKGIVVGSAGLALTGLGTSNAEEKGISVMTMGRPLLVLDMYEHAYHMDYGAAAAKYRWVYPEREMGRGQSPSRSGGEG